MSDPLPLIKALLETPQRDEDGYCLGCDTSSLRSCLPDCPYRGAERWVREEEARRASSAIPKVCAVCLKGFTFPDAMGVRLLDGRNVHLGTCASEEWLWGMPGAPAPAFAVPAEGLPDFPPTPGASASASDKDPYA